MTVLCLQLIQLPTSSPKLMVETLMLTKLTPLVEQTAVSFHLCGYKIQFETIYTSAVSTT